MGDQTSMLQALVARMLQGDELARRELIDPETKKTLIEPARTSEIQIKAKPGTNLYALKPKIVDIVAQFDPTVAEGFEPRVTVETWEEQNKTWLGAVETVGVTSGASAPERLVERVCAWFRDYGVREIKPFASVYEDVVFRLPVELRRAETPAA